MKCLKIDLRKVNFKKSIAWNVWYQFGIDIDNTDKIINVTKHYMPQEEQDKLVEYMLKNYKKLLYYKGYGMSKGYIKHKFSWEILNYFPRSGK